MTSRSEKREERSEKESEEARTFVASAASRCSPPVASAASRWPLLPSPFATVAALALFSFISSPVFSEDPAPAEPAPAQSLFVSVKVNPWVSVPRHAGTYPDLQLVWNRVEEVADVSAIWPHPLIPSRAVLATTSGLLITEDSGRSFKPLPGGSVEKIGPVLDIAFPSDKTDVFYAATKKQGIWIATDNGAAFKQLASKATGLAGDCVQSLEFHAGDITGRTLVAGHGESAPGLSRSTDGGQTWDILHKEHHVHRVYTARSGTQGIYIVASKVSDPEAQGLYILPSLGEPWQEMLHEVVCTSFAAPIMGDDSVLVSTADRGLLRIARSGGVIKRIGPEDVDSWASVGATWGPTADSQLIFAFDPKKLGMVVWATATAAEDSELLDNLPISGPPVPHSRGLYTNAIVREGAHLRANANGTVFYAAVNSMLYRAARGTSGMEIVEASVKPAVNRFDPLAQQNALDQVRDALAKFPKNRNLPEAGSAMLEALKAHEQAMAGQRITITAKIKSDGPKPQSVTVDLSRLGLPPDSVLLDDGQHDDGTAGDGVYANSFPLGLLTYRRPEKEWRRSWPGIIGLTVTAAGDKQPFAGAVIPYSIVNPGGGVPFWEREQWHHVAVDQGKIKPGSAISARGHRRGVALSVETPGPWRARMSGTRKTLDASGAAALVLTIRTAEDCTDDILVSLRDEPVYAESVTTPGVALLAEGLVPAKKFTPAYQRIVIPMALITKDAEAFQRASVQSVVLSGKASKPVQIMVDEISFSYTAETPVKGKVTP